MGRYRMIALIGDVPLSGIEPAPMYMRNWKIMIGRMIVTKRIRYYFTTCRWICQAFCKEILAVLKKFLAGYILLENLNRKFFLRYFTEESRGRGKGNIPEMYSKGVCMLKRYEVYVGVGNIGSMGKYGKCKGR